MYRIKNRIYPFINGGAVGDVVCTLPILLEMFKYKHINKIILNSRFIELFSLFFPESILIDDEKNKVKVNNDKGEEVIMLNLECDDKDGVYVTFLNAHKDKDLPNSLGTHLVDIASINLSGKMLALENKFLPLVERKGKKINSDNYVVLASGYTNEIRKMRDDSFIAIKDYLISQGYDVVLLGSSKHLLSLMDNTGNISKEVTPSFVGEKDGCIDMVDKTTLVEALDIINWSKGIIGLDNGLIHLAGLTDVPIVVGYTNCNPEFRVPIRRKGKTSVVVPPSSVCRFCQTDNYCTFNYDFAKCLDNSYNCTKSLTPSVWLSTVSSVFNDK